MQLDEAIVDTLAVARLARLVTADTITRPWRTAIIRKAYGPEKTAELSDAFVDRMVRDDHEAPRLAELITCQWCSSQWVAFGVVAARRFAPRLWQPVAVALAMSQVTGMLASHAE